MNYREAIAIEEHSLDREWAGHPELYMDLVEAKVESREKLDLARDAYSVLRAECSARIRANPSKYGIGDKVTEGAINAAVDSHPKVQAANARITALKREHDLVSGAVDAMEHRKKALENLVQLHLSNYRGEVRMPKALRGKEDAVAEVLDKPAQSRVANNMNSRRRN
jgi:hypothetical protein